MGPKTTLRIDKSKTDASTLQLLSGSTRAKVIKAFNSKNVFFIKTKTAAMGVRATDFEVEYQELDGVATTKVTVFEGIVDVTEDATGQTTALTVGESMQMVCHRRDARWRSGDGDLP